MVRFIDDHREVYGLEPICRIVPIAPSTNFQWKAWVANPESRSKRAREDDGLKAEIHRARVENRHVYGAEKVWRELGRQGDYSPPLPRGAVDARGRGHPGPYLGLHHHARR